MIRSTFAGFTTAQLAMAASQRAFDVTGQNIANINTTGYTRQRLDISSLNHKYAAFYNPVNRVQIGFGVDITGVSQLRDPFLDIQYRNQMSKLGTSDAQAAVQESLTPIIDEAMDDGIRTALRSVTSALDKYSSQVTNKEFDTMVRSEMQNLINLMHEKATRLKEVRDDTAQGFETTDVADLNQLLENIANLNKSIKTSQILGNDALELQDERNNLLDELSSYLPISVEYSNKKIGPTQTVEILDVYFTDSDGARHRLISDNDYATFQTDVSDPKNVTLHLQDAKSGKVTDVTEKLGNGTLKGTLDMLNKSGEFDGTDVRGIGYYEKALDTLANKFAEVFNELNKKPQVDANGDPVKPLTLEDAPLFEASDNSGKITAANIKISEGWQTNEYGLTTTVVLTEDGKLGSTANDNIMNMVKAMSNTQNFTYKLTDANGNPRTTTFFKGSFYDCYANIESTLAVDSKSTTTRLENQITVVNQTSNSRDGVSGVQLDEEGMNLMHYNQSYNAAARLMTALDEALNTLINNTGLVGR